MGDRWFQPSPSRQLRVFVCVRVPSFQVSALEADQNVPIEQLLQRYNHSAVGSSSSALGVSDMDVDVDTDEGREMEDQEELEEKKDMDSISEEKDGYGEEEKKEKEGEEEDGGDGERCQGLRRCEAELQLPINRSCPFRVMFCRSRTERSLYCRRLWFPE